jgi:hypothetical protein
MEASLDSLQYPVGRFVLPEEVTKESIAAAIEVIRKFPLELEDAIRDMDDAQLNVPYRPGGWNTRQVVHHCADSHMNALIRFKWALTEDNPVIKPYWQDKWAELPDMQAHPAVSIAILKSVHQRWVNLMQQMTDTDWKRTYIHPEHNKQFSLKQVVMNYEWHCRHHLGHVRSVK